MEEMRRLRAECASRLRTIAVPHPFDLDVFCASIAAARHRPLYLRPLPRQAGVSVLYGLWIATDRDDHIFHTRGATSLHKLAIVLHEIAHMLCDHRADDAIGDLLPSLDQRMVRSVLGRHAYSTHDEQEAETLATLLFERATRDPDGRSAGAAGDLLARLSDDLEHPVRVPFHG